MGIDYYLVDKSKKKLYELGKGSWFKLNLEYIGNEELLCLDIENNCYYRDTYSDEEWQEIKKYIKERVAPDLHLCFFDSNPKDLILFNDTTDDLYICRTKQYYCVGTRYYEIGSKEWENCMAHQSKHLIDNEHNKRFYNPEEARKYPEWERY